MMVELLKVNGKIIKCMVEVYLGGKMAESIMENTKKIKSMD
jgi:hypothetical protein